MRMPATALVLLLAAACGSSGTPATSPAPTTPPVTPPTTAPPITPSASPTPSATPKTGHAAIGTTTYPEVGCEATHDAAGATLGYYAVFGQFTGRALNGDRPTPHVVVDVPKGYRGDGTYTANVRAVITRADGSSTDAPATVKITHSGGAGTVAVDGKTVTFSCDPADAVAPTAATPAPKPIDDRNTALWTRDSGAVVRYTELRCGRGTGDNGYYSAPGSYPHDQLEQVTLETNLQTSGILTVRHFGIELVYSPRDYKAEIGDGEIRYLHAGVLVAKIEWACRFN